MGRLFACQLLACWWNDCRETIGIESNIIGTRTGSNESENAASIGLDYRIIPGYCFFAYAAYNYTTHNTGFAYPTIGVNIHFRNTPGVDVNFKIGKPVSKEVKGTDLGLQIAIAL